MKKRIRQSINTLNTFFKVIVILYIIAFTIGFIAFLVLKMPGGYCFVYFIVGVLAIIPLGIFWSLLISTLEEIAMDDKDIKARAKADPYYSQDANADEDEGFDAVDERVEDDTPIDPSMLGCLPREDIQEEQKDD